MKIYQCKLMGNYTYFSSVWIPISYALIGVFCNDLTLHPVTSGLGADEAGPLLLKLMFFS